MGLLSDPEYGSVKWVKILKKIYRPLCFLCYVGAIVWFAMLGDQDFNNETYFSENALLPGLVTNEFNGEQAANQFFKEFQDELQDKYDDTDEIPVPWFVAKMSQLHLEVYTHNFTLNYPLGQGQTYKGTNVYGILRAPRTSSLEALVVTVSFRPLSSHQKGTAAGIALMLAFAQFARSQKYWAKDIIFLVTEHEQLGMQAWLEAYHGLHSDAETFYTSLGSFFPSGSPALDLSKMAESFSWAADHKKCLNPGKLKGRSGSIQAAINLEFHTPMIKYVEVKVEGLNGQLPNLDLVNLVHRLCAKSGINRSFKNSYSWIRQRGKMDEWTSGVLTMLGMVASQVAGVPNGNHGLFHRFGIEAVTLEGRDEYDPAGVPPRVDSLSPAKFYRLGIALESILRSLNNLLERFHQSYFFYVLAATNRFISIGQYMPSLCLLCVAMLVRALALWVSIQQDDEATEVAARKRKNSDTDDSDQESADSRLNEDSEEIDESDAITKVSEGCELRHRKHKTSECEMVKDQPQPPSARTNGTHYVVMNDTNISLVNIGTNYLLVHLLGYIVMNSPTLLSAIGAIYFNEPSEVSVYYGLIAISVLLIIVTPMLLRILRKGPLHNEELTLVNILVLVELATVCLAVGMHNFSLGLVIGVVYTPLALIVGVIKKNGSPVRVLLKRIVCLILQPLCFLTLAMIVYSKILFPEESFLEMAGRGRDAAMQATMFSVVDSLIYGNWLFNVATSLLLPTWIIFWQILCNTED
ncbi:hypothetical protein ACJJTC_000846 [Scirpophaga incertulas]